MPTCPNCGNETAAGAVFCDQCGTRMPAAETAVAEAPPAPAGGSTICPACGAGNVPGEAFCDFCGSPLDAPLPAAPEAPAPEPASIEAETPVEGAVPGDVQAACPACGADVQPGEAFCADCGASLAEPRQAPEARDVVEPSAEAAPVAAEHQVPEASEIAEPPAETLPPVVDRQVPEAREAMEPADEEAAVATDRQVPEVRETLEEPTPPPPATEPAGAPACPACGVEVVAGDKFCSNCGAVLRAVSEAAPAEAAVAPSPPAGPRLVVVASGAEIPLPAGDEILIGREDPVSGVFPQVDLTPHGGEEGGVSRRHARLMFDGVNYSVEDLDSTNFTFVNKQKLTPGTPLPIRDGDEMRCGRVALVLKA